MSARKKKDTPEEGSPENVPEENGAEKISAEEAAAKDAAAKDAAAKDAAAKDAAAKDAAADEDVDFEPEPPKETPAFCGTSLKAPFILIGAMVAFVLLWAILVKQEPSLKQVSESWGEPEKSLKLLKKMGGAINVAAAQGLIALPVGARWTVKPPHAYRGSCHNCHPYSNTAAVPREAPRMAAVGQQAAVIDTLAPLPPNARRSITPPHPERGSCHSCHPFSRIAWPAAAKIKPVTIKEVALSVTDTSAGVFVVQAFKQGWGEKGGIKHGDIITSFNRRSVPDVAKFQKLMLAASPERRTPFKVLRAGKTLKLNVMVGEGELEGVILPTQEQIAKNMPGPGEGLIGQVAAMQPGSNNPMGGGSFGARPNSLYVMCPACGFKMTYRAGVPAHMVKCPKDGSQMIREDLMRAQRPAANLQGGGVYPWGPRQGGGR